MKAEKAIPRIGHTRAGKITDEHLDHIHALSRQVEQGEVLDNTSATLLRITVPALLHELRLRRAAMDLIQDFSTDLGNVRFLAEG